jgi:hypothetical protein
MPTAPSQNGRQLDNFNDQLRETPLWADFMRRNGIDTSRPIRLSDSQRKALQRELEASGTGFPQGLEIDPAGNINQNQSPGKKIAIAAAIAGLAATGLGAAGIGPLAGVMGAGAGAAGAGGATLGTTGLSAVGAQSAASILGAAPVAAGAAGGGAAAAGGGALGFLRGGWRDLAGAGGAALGAISETQANNRGTQFGGQMDLERLLMDRDESTMRQTIAREQEGREGGSDAWRKLMAAQNTLSPSTRPSLSPYSVAPRTATDPERQGAEAMSAEVLARLQGGNPLAPVERRPMSIDPNLLRPGGVEQATGWLSPVLSFIGRRGGR